MKPGPKDMDTQVPHRKSNTSEVLLNEENVCGVRYLGDAGAACSANQLASYDCTQ